MTLDILSKNELIAVLDELKDCIGIKQVAQKRVQEIQQVFIDDENMIKKKKKYRIILFVIAGFITYGYGAFAVGIVGVGINALLSGLADDNPIFIIVALLGVIFLVGLVLFWRFLIKNYKKKTEQERIAVEKHQSGIYAYIPYYQGIYIEYQNRENALCAKYNIHNNIRAIGVIDYVKSVMISNSTISFREAVDDYYTIQHNEMILDEMYKSNNILKEMQQDNQDFYERKLQNDAEIIEIGRQATEHLNHLRYD